MTETEYQLLTRVCDDILLAPNPSVERIGIGWLHVLREHPHNLAPYLDLFNDRSSASSGWIRRTAEGMLLGLRALRESGRWFYGDELPKSADVLFVSHFLNETQAGAGNDFYFGELPSELASRGKTCVVALLNHSGRSPRFLRAKWVPASVPRILLSSTIGLRGDVALRRRLSRESLRLRSEAKAALPAFHRRTLLFASGHAGSMASVSNLRIGEQIAELVRRTRPKAIVLTYEGHAWERLAFAAARRAHPQIRCIGYHHTVLFRRQHALKRRLGPEFDPDIVLTAGAATRDQLAEAPGLKGIPIAVLGTHRRELTPRSRPPGEPPTCLVIPEGLPGECVFLFKFALACANLAPTIRFVFRMHPVLPFASIVALDRRLGSPPENVTLSEALIADDFSRSRWALYRGSSAVVHAVLAGLRPVYVSRRDEMPIDPLHQLASWRTVTETPDDCVRQINLDMATDQESLVSEAQPAIRYCEKYFMPVDVAALESAIDFN